MTELGRRALADQISMLEIIENHSRLVYGQDSGSENAVALQFLLQTLAALDVATRGFIDGTRRYEQQRARADDLSEERHPNAHELAGLAALERLLFRLLLFSQLAIIGGVQRLLHGGVIVAGIVFPAER